jgi:hypothetical protein
VTMSGRSVMAASLFVLEMKGEEELEARPRE